MSEFLPASQTAKFSVQASHEDWDAFLNVCRDQAHSKPPAFSLLLLIGIPLAVLLLELSKDKSLADFFLILFGIGTGAIGLMIWGNRIEQSLAPEPGGQFLTPRTLEISPAGVVVTSKDVESRLDWQAITKVSHTKDHLFLWLDKGTAEVIPLRELPVEVEAATLLQLIERARGVAHDSIDLTPSIAAPQTASTSERPEPKTVWLALLSAIAVGSWVLLDWLTVGPDVELKPYGIPGIAWYAIPLLVAAAAFSAMATPRLGFRQALFWLLIFTPVFLLIKYLVDSENTLLTLLTGFLVFLAAIRSATGRIQWLPIALAIATVSTFIWLDNKIYVEASLWYSTNDDTQSYGAWEQAEELLFSQGAIIDRIVDEMATPQAAPAAFFVGFAGYAEEKVFAEEIKFADRILGDRYGSNERSLLLLNDIRATDQAPLATVSGLRHGLQQIAKRMDLDNDLLILALSSHGSAAPLLSISHGYLPLQDLDGDTLSAALDDAGIKWRLIVVSACYSGAFIEELTDSKTAIITAAAADRTSFGCSNDRDLTYFGEAFYRDALPQQDSLRVAFDKAKTLVTEREKEEGMKASNPQAFFGADIDKKLEELEVL